MHVHPPHALVLQLSVGIFEGSLPLVVCSGRGWCRQLVSQSVERRKLLMRLDARELGLQQRIFLSDMSKRQEPTDKN